MEVGIGDLADQVHSQFAQIGNLQSHQNRETINAPLLFFSIPPFTGSSRLETRNNSWFNSLLSVSA